MNFNLWLYHTVEVHLCDVRILFWRTYTWWYQHNSKSYQQRIDQLERQLAR